MMQPMISEDEELLAGAEDEGEVVNRERPPLVRVLSEAELEACASTAPGSFLEPLSPPDDEPPLHAGGSKIKIMICSANLGNKMVRNLDPWIPPGAPGVDLVVLGMQESTYSMEKDDGQIQDKGADSSDEEGAEEVSPATAASSPATRTARAQSAQSSTRSAATSIGGREAADGDLYSSEGDKHLLLELKNQLGEEWEFVHAVRRKQMRIRMYARREIFGELKDLEFGAENTGIAHVVANKGGQVIKIRIRDTTLCFVNSHLAAHEGKMAKRNENIVEIVNGVRLGDQAIDMYQFDHIFWFGDLNYRISIPGMADKQEQCAKVMAKIDEGKFADLWAYDELGHEVTSKRVLTDFHSAPCDFKPTFKLKRQVGNAYNLKRTPSFCDRVLYRSLPGHANRLDVLEFTSADDFSTSDHKPVRALISVEPSPPVQLLHSVPTGMARFPQLKFFNLRAKGLAALDTGVVLTKQTLEEEEEEEEEPGSLGGSGKRRKRRTVRQSMRMERAKSDPYIIFKPHPPDLFLPHQRGLRTEHIRQTLDPVWRSEPLCSCRAGTYEELAKAHLTLQLMDFDVIGQHDLIGTVTLALADVCAAADSQEGLYHFTADVMRYSTKHGTLSGSVEVNTPGPSGEFRWHERLVEDHEGGLTVANCGGTCSCTIS